MNKNKDKIAQKFTFKRTVLILKKSFLIIGPRALKFGTEM